MKLIILYNYEINQMGICLGTETKVETTSKVETIEIIDKPDTKVETTPLPKWEDTLVFVPPITDGIVIKVYDGDTITIAQKLPYENSPLFRFAIRLNGIDSPEIKTKYESEKKYAERSRDALHDLIFEKTVTLRNISLEKYGRILADVYYNDIHINKWLLDNKYAIAYDGTKKREWNDVITLYEKNNFYLVDRFYFLMFFIVFKIFYRVFTYIFN